ncbi:unnamed protein product [Eretmochelys imbricata]
MTHLICSVSISELVTTVIRSELCAALRSQPWGSLAWVAGLGCILVTMAQALFYWKTN